MKLRGYGDLLGFKQSGLKTFRLADPILNEDLFILAENEIKNIEVVTQICNLLDDVYPKKNGGSYSDQITFVEDRLGHDYRYGLNISKIENELGWSLKENFD